ncbi:MAG: thiamine phosphate synthase [Parvularculaceae bacterium]
MSEILKERSARLARAARALNSASGVEAPFYLAFATDCARGPEASLVARALAPGGALILRDYDDENRAARARALRKICAERGVLFLVGGDEPLARAVGADGLHLRSDQLRAGAQRRAGILSASCHSAEELERAAAIGADVAILGPVFATPSHPGAAALGPARFTALAADAALPVFAIGGVDETNASTLAGKNVAGFVAIGAFNAKRAPGE